MHAMTIGGRAVGAIALGLALSAGVAGCSDKMTLDSNLKTDLSGDLKTAVSGDLNTALKVEGPIQISMQVQGPTIRYEGTYVSDEMLEAIKVGKTTDDWVLAVLGEPTAKSDLRDGTTIWRWTYKPIAQEAAVVEIFSDEKKEPKLATRTVFIQLLDRVVVEKWKG